MPPPADVRIAAQGTEAGAGRVDEHAVERRRERQRVSEIRLHDSHVRRAADGDGLAQQIDAAIAEVGRDQQPASLHRRRDFGRLAAG